MTQGETYVHGRESPTQGTQDSLSNTIFQGAVDVLFDGGYLNAVELKRAFYDAGICLNSRDMEDLIGLKPGTLETESKIVPYKPKIEPKC